VEYKSAHIDGVESEFIVRSGHSCQGHPFAIEEVRRILLEHLGVEVAGSEEHGATKAKAGIAPPVPPVSAPEAVPPVAHKPLPN
jgi:hypothetical protein